jgi:hypothetical protein
MPEFIKGLTLSGLYYDEVVRPILESEYPDLRYSAALIGWGSDVLGYDDSESVDHMWGLRLYLFFSEQDRERYDVGDTLSKKLPYEFRGYPTNFAPTGHGELLVMKAINSGPVNHLIYCESVESFFNSYLGCAPDKELKTEDWLTFYEHRLLTVTAGKVFYDGLRTLEPVRRKFSYYPDEIWRYLLSRQWKAIGDEEDLLGRCGSVGDELGSTIIAARLVKNLMKLCFLMERRYTPYRKWMGTAFSRLQCGPELGPMLQEVLLARSWKQREEFLRGACEMVARLHHKLGIAEPLDKSMRDNDRPYQLIDGGRFSEAIRRTIKSEELERIDKAWGFKGGSINQLIESDHDLAYLKFCEKFKSLYR